MVLKGQQLTVKPGQTASFTCTIKGKVRWKFTGTQPVKNIKVLDANEDGLSSIKIENVQKNGQGKFMCYGEDNNNFYFEGSATLIVEGHMIQYLSQSASLVL